MYNATQLVKQLKEQELELRWLRYFYGSARHGMGPADSEIYDSIKAAYLEIEEKLPAGYDLEEDCE